MTDECGLNIILIGTKIFGPNLILFFYLNVVWKNSECEKGLILSHIVIRFVFLHFYPELLCTAILS